MERRKLSDSEIERNLTILQDWFVEDGKLTKVFESNTYANGAIFALAVSHLAERMDHHPDIKIGYKKITISVNTHDVNGISEWDFELARRIESIA